MHIYIAPLNKWARRTPLLYHDEGREKEKKRRKKNTEQDTELPKQEPIRDYLPTYGASFRCTSPAGTNTGQTGTFLTSCSAVRYRLTFRLTKKKVQTSVGIPAEWRGVIGITVGIYWYILVYITPMPRQLMFKLATHKKLSLQVHTCTVQL